MKRTILLLLILSTAWVPSHAQSFSAPTITNQPVSRVVWAGATVTFSVGVSATLLSPTNTGATSYWKPLFGCLWRFTPPGQTGGFLSQALSTNMSYGGILMDLNLPFPKASASSVAVDGAGSLYLADFGNRCVYKYAAGPGTNYFVAGGQLPAVFAGTGPVVPDQWPVNPLGDGGPAAQATFGGPSGLATDAAGDVFIADARYNLVRKVDTNGIITTFAGGGVGDYAAATNAILLQPSGLAVDQAGNLYVADANNNRVRKIGTNGIITTVAGNQWPVAMNGPSDVSGYFTGDGGPAVRANLYYPRGVTVDAAGDVFIADTYNNRIRKVGTNGIIATLAGIGPAYNFYLHPGFPNSSGGFSGDGSPATNAAVSLPLGLATDAKGNLFIADSNNGRIRKVDANGVITTFAGSTNFNSNNRGFATNATLAGPAAVAVDPAGNVFITDAYFSGVYKVDTNGIISTAAGSTNFLPPAFGDGGPATNAFVWDPVDVAFDAAGNLYIADARLYRVRKVDTNGIITTIAGNGTNGYSGDGGPATNACLMPGNLAADAWGNVFVADPTNNCIRKIDTSGIITTVAGCRPPDYIPAYYDDGDLIYSVPGGAYYGDGGRAASALLEGPGSVAVDRAGNVFIADAGSRVRKVDTNGIITTVAGNGTNGCSGDGGPATNASLLAEGVAVDPAGNLFISGRVVRKVDPNGIISTFAGGGTNDPGDGGAATNASSFWLGGMAADAAGNLFLAWENTNNSGPGGLFYTIGSVREITANGIIQTVAGGGVFESALEPDPVVAFGAFLYANGVAVDAGDNLFIAADPPCEVQPVTPAQGSVLTLSNVTAANAGSYFAVPNVGSSSRQSQTAVLTVVTNPVIYQTACHADGSVTLGFVAPPGSTNQVLCATNLAPPVAWQSIATCVAGPDGDWTFTDTNVFSSPARFYRSSSY